MGPTGATGRWVVPQVRPVDPVALRPHTQLHAERRQPGASIQTSYSRQSSSILDRRRQVLSTPDRPLSLFISYSPTVGVQWQNFLSPEFGIKYQMGSTIIFWIYSNFCKIKCSIGLGKPACKNAARFVQPFQYSTSL